MMPTRYTKAGCPPLSARRRARRRRAMTIMELMVAVGLLGILMVALLAALRQTQRAFRTGVNQVDVLESGRAVMGLFATELQEIAPSGLETVTNLYIGPPGAPVHQWPLPTGPWPAVLQEFFYLSQYNDRWFATKYSFEAQEWQTGVATLYRRTIEVPWYALSTLQTNTIVFEPAGAGGVVSPEYHRVADGVVHLRLRAFDAEGYPILNTPTNGVVVVTDAAGFDSYLFYGTNVPAYLDVELGVLDPKVLEGFRARAAVDATFAWTYLTNRPGSVHIFQQRIPIRPRVSISP